MNAPQDLPALDEYVDMPKLLPIVAHTFPSPDSLKWWIRQNHDELVERGALITITGRLRFHPARFQQVAVEIGRRVAKKST